MLLLAVVPHDVSARTSVGVYRGWGAFRDEGPRRCYALAAPLVPGRGASAAVGYWPARRASAQLHVRFARPARAGSAILLTIDGRVFQLRGNGRNAWAPGPAANRAIVAAMRAGVGMALAARAEDGALQDDRYPLTGAASAMDAAAIACRPR